MAGGGMNPCVQDNSKGKSRTERRNQKIIIKLLAVFAAISVVIMLVANGTDYSYHAFALKNITCRIPEEMIESEDIVFTNDHMFAVIDKEADYLIYSSQLELADDDDKEYTLFSDYEDSMLLNYDTVDAFVDSVKESSNLLQTVTDVGKTSKHSYVKYCVSGEAYNEYDGYYTYIVSYCGHDVRFVEVILYKKPEQLSNRQKKEILERLVFD